MKTFECRFTGRQVGAIGIFYKCKVRVEATSEPAAHSKLYDTHEHITGLKIREIKPRKKTIQQRLEYLRGELRSQRLSWGEIHELQTLAAYILPGDVELLEAAGIPEHKTP